MSKFNAQKLAAMVRAKRGLHSLREAAEAIGVSASTLLRLERGQITDIDLLLSVCDWLQKPLQEFLLQEEKMTTTINLEDLASQIRWKCQRAGWFGPEDFHPDQTGCTWSLRGFWCPPAAEGQIRLTEEILGFDLPPALVFLYTTLANGGFGPGAGLRGLLGGYGTRYTAIPNGETFLNEESIAKYQYAHLLPLTGYPWQQQGETQVLRLPADRWPQGLFPICDLGDCQEVCLDKEGQVFYWYSSDENGANELKASSSSFEQWLFEWCFQ